MTSTVYRVAREALTNVLRHAPGARSVTVTVEQGPEGVTVEVAGPAPAAPPRHSHRGGYGLVGMRERVESLGGSLRAGPRPGGGWSPRTSPKSASSGRRPTGPRRSTWTSKSSPGRGRTTMGNRPDAARAPEWSTGRRQGQTRATPSSRALAATAAVTAGATRSSNGPGTT
ncbi:sensor histidine kinase [Spirillospora sp. CA-108201]